ncbi:putative transcription factor bHLH family [Lupinus albus]|uniref:Putative transcription factor bHLH family n=1 Tax=Lupinus albus TaxID=3870 RepID=A0A6A4QRX1_LUPAL|nr:putative transcription factor bHLH family [Lupinus albus]
MGCTAARKTQKADREKLRRDRLNEQFAELNNILDPEQPKNDKATILGDTIQLLNDLSSQVSKLKDEYTALNEESRELAQEKNDLKEEKASLKLDIENLNNQYQQRLRTVFPWTAMDHSVMMAPPSYPYPMPVPSSPTHVSTYVPYLAPNTVVEQQSTQYISPPVHPGGWSHVSSKQHSKHKSSRESSAERSQASNEVTMDLELKTPGSSADQHLSSGQRKSSKSSRKENSCAEGSSLGRSTSSHSIQDSSSSSVAGSRKANE